LASEKRDDLFIAEFERLGDSLLRIEEDGEKRATFYITKARRKDRTGAVAPHQGAA